MLQILIVDDHALLRKGLTDLLETHAGWKVCGEANDGREAVLLAEKLKPDVAVVDLAMPELNGIEATRRMREVSPGTAVLVLAGAYSERIEAESFSAGARGFVLKSSSEDRVVEAIESLVKGDTFFVRDASRRAGERAAPAGAREQGQAAGLTSRLYEPAEQSELLTEGIGLTNAALRTTPGSGDLRSADFDRTRIERLARDLRPGWIAFVGKEAYRGTFGERPELGAQERRLAETRLFVLPSTSPANAAVPWEERLRWFRELAAAAR